MEYIKSSEIDPINTFFHFTRIDNRKSIEENGLQSVAGGENEAAMDREHKTIYFSKGVSGILKAVDVWARWEYGNLARRENSKGHKIKQEYEEKLVEGIDQSYDREVMNRIIFSKLYDDFKNRQYYTVELIEGKDGDFEYGDIDVKKIFSRDKNGRPYPGALWKYGPYSDFGTIDEPNNLQEEWNMNTKFGDRKIPIDRLKIVETQDGKSDGLSVIIEFYDKYRGMVSKENDSMFEILDNFISYAKEKYMEDVDFKKGAPDYGRREISVEEEKKYQSINKINISGNEDKDKDKDNTNGTSNENNKNNKQNRLFSMISKFVDRIKRRFKSQDVKMLPKDSQDTSKEESTKTDLRKDFIESLKVSPEELSKGTEIKEMRIIEEKQDENDGTSFDD